MRDHYLAAATATRLRRIKFCIRVYTLLVCITIVLLYESVHAKKQVLSVPFEKTKRQSRVYLDFKNNVERVVKWSLR